MKRRYFDHCDWGKVNARDLKTRTKTARRLSFSQSLNLALGLADFAQRLKWQALKDRHPQATKKQLLEKFQNQVYFRPSGRTSPGFYAFILKSLKNATGNK